VQPNFIKLLARKLQPNGMLHIVTDWPNYAEHIDAVISAHSDFEYLPAAPDDRVTTRFDSRGARLGHSNWERAWCTRSKIRADGK
jgi:tRNA (guanine-N7-)-methyltransferase